MTLTMLTIFGAILFTAIGSFTCVVIDRLPLPLEVPNRYGELWDTRSWREVLAGTSRCSSCAEPVKPYDNVPVVSWLLLRGRCRCCRESIPAFHPLVEAASPALFVITMVMMDRSWLLLPVLWLIPVGLAVGVIDLRTLIVPTRIVWPAFGVSLVLSVVAAGVSGEWSLLLSASVGLVAFAGPLFLLWFFLPNGMGFGDVRLATLLGWTVGFYAGGNWIHGLFLGVLSLGLAALIGIIYGILALGARGRKAKVPFGPALISSAYICSLLAPRILEPLR